MRTVATDVFNFLSVADKQKTLAYLEKVFAKCNSHKVKDVDYYEVEAYSGINSALILLRNIMKDSKKDKWELFRKTPHNTHVSELLKYAFRKLRIVRKRAEHWMWESLCLKVRYSQYGRP